MSIRNKILWIFYPKRCCFCGKVSETEVCLLCKEKIFYIEEPRCKKCGRPVRYEEQEYCYECQKIKFHYNQGKSIWLHKTPVRESIYQFKYHNRRIYGEFYAKEVYRLFQRELREWRIDVIIPVPLHKRRKRLRGYNQAEIIAETLGKLADIPVNTKVVKRKKYTRPQKELSDKERKANLKDAFCVQKDWEIPQNILLIDDIYTTGSTIDTIAKCLKEKAECNVWFLTISIGQDF